jgi:Flp pilus assembly protein TadB
MQCALAVTGQTPEQVVGRTILGVGLGLVVPPTLWAAAAAFGVSIPLLAPVVLTVVMVPAAGCLPVATLYGEAAHRRHHVRTVVATYVDLVVLSLAGGVGIEGSLVAAAEISPDWAARRIARSLSLARDTGEPAWEALQALGAELGVTELMELAASLQLAGTEGARVRQSLSAMAASLRRHEQAEAESAANAATERLFLPGALLLVGFLLFVGYPAVSRILTGF